VPWWGRIDVRAGRSDGDRPRTTDRRPRIAIAARITAAAALSSVS
jgi:hypothetical protein